MEGLNFIGLFDPLTSLQKTYPLLTKFGHMKKLTFANVLNLIRNDTTIPWH